MIFLDLFIGLALLKRSIRTFTIIIITAVAYKEPVISVLFYLKAYSRLEV
jgi:hypothetical protein